jgi:hypothetical protein
MGKFFKQTAGSEKRLWFELALKITLSKASA